MSSFSCQRRCRQAGLNSAHLVFLKNVSFLLFNPLSWSDMFKRVPPQSFFYNYGVSCHYSSFSRGLCVECAVCLPLSPASLCLCYGILMSGCCARRGRLFSVSIIVVWQYAFCLFSSGLSFCQTTMCRYFSYSALMTLSRWSTVSSSRSAFSMSISRGALSTAFAVSRPRPFIASITHGSTSSANSSR